MGREAKAEASGGRQAEKEERRRGERLPSIRQEDTAARNPVKISGNLKVWWVIQSPPTPKKLGGLQPCPYRLKCSFILSVSKMSRSPRRNPF